MSDEKPTVLVTGATGFIGRRLVRALVADGHTVKAMTRRPDDYAGPGEPVFGDVFDAGTLAAPMEGVDAAVYLVHSLDDNDFERKDAEAAKGVRPGRRSQRRAPDRLHGRPRGRTATTCRRTCARAARSSGCSARPAYRSPCCAPRSWSAPAASRGR